MEDIGLGANAGDAEDTLDDADEEATEDEEEDEGGTEDAVASPVLDISRLRSNHACDAAETQTTVRIYHTCIDMTTSITNKPSSI
jgi:hypothetical protein